MNYTPESITELKPGEIFVFGTNQYASHGGGAAAFAKKHFGLVEGEGAIGLSGKCYGIITTTDDSSYIGQQILVLYGFAKMRPELTFLVTKIGCGIAGFELSEIARLFKKIEFFKPSNIILPKEFTI